MEKNEVQKEINKLNELIKQKGYKWKAGVTSRSYLSDEQLKKFIGLPKHHMNKSLPDTAHQDNISNASSGEGVLSTVSSSLLGTPPNWKPYMIKPKYTGVLCAPSAAVSLTEGLLNYNCAQRNIVFYSDSLGIDQDSGGIKLDEYYLSQNVGSCNIFSCCFDGLKAAGIPCIVKTIPAFPNFANTRYGINYYNSVKPTSVETIKRQLEYSPVWAAMDAYYDFEQFYIGGVYKHVPDPDHPDPTGHAVVIVSYNDFDSCWICKNSWSDKWGEGGYFRIAYGQCNIDSYESVTASVDDNCFPGIVPNFYSLTNALNNQDRNHGWIYVFGNQTLTSNSQGLLSPNHLIVKSGATIDLNGYALTAVGNWKNMGNDNGIIEVEPGAVIDHCAELQRFSNGSIAGYYPGNLENLWLESAGSGYKFVILPPKTVNISAGSTVKFSNGSYFEVNGTLNANGTSSSKITFDFISPSSGNGIHFNYGSSGNISYANIKNAYYGVYTYNSSPRLNSNTFTGNYYGVYCENYASPLLTGNTISGSSIGVKCTYNGNPTLTVTTYGTGNNVITQNGYGIDAYQNSSPFIGGVYSGDNSIYANTSYNLHAAYGGIIYAMHTWWGSYPISSQDLSKIYSYQATINYSQPDASDPNAGRPLSKINYAENSSNQGQSSSGTEDVLLQGLSLQAEAKYNEAISSYVNFIKNNIKTPKAILALSKLSECYQLTGRNDFIDYLNSSIRPNLSKEDEISLTTLELENFWLTRQGKYDQAIKNIGKIKNDYPDKKESYKYALFNEGFTYYAFLKDSSKAKDAFSKLQKLYPEDHLVVEAKLLLGENPGTLPVPKLMPGNALVEENEVNTVKPKEFELFGNFPNPFNPSTVIRYDLPTSSKVELRVYDILGKEVMTLVNGNQGAGRYNASFNATGLPSGIYIYSFKALSLENGKSFEKNSKILYLK